jgi:hypothetical protein
MQPRTYFLLARLLADRAQVIIPAIFDLPGTWTFPVALWPVSKPPWTLSVDVAIEVVEMLGFARSAVVGRLP